MNRERHIQLGLVGWYAVADGVNLESDWLEWAQGKRKIGDTLPSPGLEIIPSRFTRRLGKLGRCVMATVEQFQPLIKSQPAILSVSRHGDLLSTSRLLNCISNGEDVSPTAFTYSVHNRFAGMVSMFAGYKGISGAYSSDYDGFAMTLVEASIILQHSPDTQVVVLAYEPEIPVDYIALLKRCWKPHVVAFVLAAVDTCSTVLKLSHYVVSDQAEKDGSCLPFIKMLVSRERVNDGHWQYGYVD